MTKQPKLTGIKEIGGVYDLPEGWKLVKLEEVCESFKGGIWGEEGSPNDGTPVIRSTEAANKKRYHNHRNRIF